MDINLIREAVTVASLLVFLGIAFWAYRPSRKDALERQGRSVLEDAS